MKSKRTEPTHSFLMQFPWQLRGAIGNYFYNAVRDGHDEPAAVCSTVWQYLQEKLQSEPDVEGKGVQKREVCARMREDKDGALDFAAHVIAREAGSSDGE